MCVWDEPCEERPGTNILCLSTKPKQHGQQTGKLPLIPLPKFSDPALGWQDNPACTQLVPIVKMIVWFGHKRVKTHRLVWHISLFTLQLLYHQMTIISNHLLSALNSSLIMKNVVIVMRFKDSPQYRLLFLNCLVHVFCTGTLNQAGNLCMPLGLCHSHLWCKGLAFPPHKCLFIWCLSLRRGCNPLSWACVPLKSCTLISCLDWPEKQIQLF